MSADKTNFPLRFLKHTQDMLRSVGIDVEAEIIKARALAVSALSTTEEGVQIVEASNDKPRGVTTLSSTFTINNNTKTITQEEKSAPTAMMITTSSSISSSLAPPIALCAWSIVSQQEQEGAMLTHPHPPHPHLREGEEEGRGGDRDTAVLVQFATTATTSSHRHIAAASSITGTPMGTVFSQLSIPASAMILPSSSSSSSIQQQMTTPPTAMEEEEEEEDDDDDDDKKKKKKNTMRTTRMRTMKVDNNTRIPIAETFIECQQRIHKLIAETRIQ